MRATNKKPDRSKCSNKCSSPICISDMFDKTNKHHNLIQCDHCDNWFHACCVALSITEIQFDLLDDNDEFICPLGYCFFIIRFTDPPTVYIGVLEKK